MTYIKLDDLKAYRDDRIASGNADFDEMDRLSAFIANVETVGRPSGEWENYKDEHRCSNCGEVVIGDWYDTDNWYDFCPNCGCRMKGADDE